MPCGTGNAIAVGELTVTFTEFGLTVPAVISWGLGEQVPWGLRLIRHLLLSFSRTFCLAATCSVYPVLWTNNAKVIELGLSPASWLQVNSCRCAACRTDL